MRLLGWVSSLNSDESGQAGIEYLLTLGAISVAVAAALIAGFEVIVPSVLETLCTTVDPLGGGNCLDGAGL